MSQNMICPKCQTFQPKAETCATCGVIVAKLRPAAGPVATEEEKPARGQSAGPGLDTTFLVKAGVGVIVLVGLGIWLPGVVSNFIHRDEIRLEEHLQGLPFYPELATYEPRTYDRLKQTLLTAVKSGESLERAVMRSRGMVAKVLKKRLPHAADEAVEELGLVFIDELDQLMEHGNACYKFLFPHIGPTPGFLSAADPVSYIDEETQLAELSAIAEVLRTAAEDPQDQPSVQEGERLLLTQAEKLHGRYGDSVMLLAQTSHQDTDKPTICRMYRSMMNNIMSMPAEDSSMLLRYLLAKG